MRAFEGLNKLKDKSKFDVWIRAIAVNVSKDMLRQKINNRIKIVYLFDKDNNVLDYIYKTARVDSIDEQYVKREMLKDILVHIDKLSLEEKKILFLRHYKNYTYSEIAKHMNMKQSTVGMKLLRIKEKITSKIK
ncbi:RNA polymerase sigma factor [Acetivibrio straminisolvens]|uniref:RNA polymerase sigma factor sigM n=1 Tax=Acetivibrio straminisolvens JCM 21531 TaxID=1294263 RepID=W4VAJ9_9FIRM|nr:sigma-70 family RNA polymerase sigma factor [Acetivibrio straminisolvens]GAE90415.1 RNA polymerase sigma factor sigM [Acetivibrio straminisolvens JCM 21531]